MSLLQILVLGGGGDMVVFKYLKFLFLKLAFCRYLEHILGKFKLRKGP